MTTPNILNNEELPTNPTSISYRALLVGVGEYQTYNIADLSSPPYDVERVEKILELCHFGPENITFSSIETLINGQANKSNILQSITSTFYQADNNDISYFYFTGHGSYTNNCSYLCPYDVSGNTSSAISVSELENALSAIPGTKVVILDSCFSGGFIGKNVSLKKESQKDFNQNIIQVFFEKQFGRNITGSQYQVITASKSSQTAFGVETQPGYNPFSLMTLLFCESCGYDYLIDSYKNLLPADINNDEIVSLQEAYDYIQKEMDELLPLLEAQFNMEVKQDIQAYPLGSTFTLIERDFGLEEEPELSTEEAIKSIIQSFYQSIEEKKWNDAKNYCIYNSDAFFDICDLENCIESINNSTIDFKFIGSWNIIIDENNTHTEVHLIDFPIVEPFELYDCLNVGGYVVIELKQVNGEWKIDVYRGDY
ncbi:MAG: caspase family protein [Candidatus Atribacteria bacterium]|nr:caspase family protein [Candidatus Atribacteria bacterium]